MDEQSFHELYERTARGLRAYLRHRLGSHPLADDLTQEAYLRLLKTQVPAGMDAAQLKSYLYKIALNLVRDARTARRLEPLPDQNELAGKPPLLEQAHDVRNAFARLKPKERDLLWLAYVECFNHAEIAASIKTTQGSVRPMLARARRKLAGLLQRRGYGGADGE